MLKANQLGSSAKRSGDFRLCSLHGEIIGKELGSIGFNMALSTVSDIYYRGSKTSGMYRDRAVSSDSEIVADCLVAIYEGVVLTDGIIFNSKHFPGLGRASGNTDNGVVYSEATSLNEIEEDLLPFKKLIASSIELNRPFRLSLMSSHAIYPLLDPTNVFASESKEIMTSLLRDKLSFEGINVSDAMWLGPFGDKKGDALYRKFVATLLSGIDMLMIASRDFRASYKYLNAIYYDQMPIDEQDRLLEETGYLSWEQLVQDFKYRVDESIERIMRSKADLPKSIIPSNIQPKELTKDIAQEYFDLSK
ncbi:MAG: glycoside hydrolase family 3 N-terminal domain-containing protein [Bdellovibrionota bacterium]